MKWWFGAKKRNARFTIINSLIFDRFPAEPRMLGLAQAESLFEQLGRDLVNAISSDATDEELDEMREQIIDLADVIASAHVERTKRWRKKAKARFALQDELRRQRRA